MLPFFCAKNLAALEVTETAPWEFSPTPEQLATAQAIPKAERRTWILKPGTDWSVYSAVRGVTRTLKPSKDNPPVAVRGIVVDYDKPSDDATIKKFLAGIKEPNFRPNWIERSLSGNVRLVWVFEREALVPSEAFARKLISTFMDRLNARNLLAAPDSKSESPLQQWTNGGPWELYKAEPMPWDTVFGTICEVADVYDFGGVEIPLDVIHAEIEKRFPGRWKGPFDLKLTGVRFWDDRADNLCGCQVRPDGMLCFSGRVPFMKWEAVFGSAWANNQRAINLGKIAGDTYFDGRFYYQEKPGGWKTVAREDVILWLRNRNISGKAKRDQAASDVDRVLGHIQEVNRVDGAGPLINRPPGITWLNGKRLLNSSTIRVLTPADGMPGTQDFPIVWDMLNRMFARREDMHSVDYFLAWLRRFYIGFRDYKRLMGQALFVCGPRDTGKTLLGYRVIKPLLGDTEANPYEYFTGLTSFNDELFETPLLMIHDEEATTREDARQKFIARLKSFVVNPAHSYHPKYCARVRVEWTGRIFTTLNDDDASTGLLPFVGANTRDKMMFFRCLPREGGWPEGGELEADIGRELPLFAKWLLNWTPPDYVVAKNRMGVESFFDPDIEAMSHKQNYHYTFLEVLRLWLRHDPYWSEDNNRTTYEDSAVALFGQLAAVEGLRDVMREFTSSKVARALNELIRQETPGLGWVDCAERRVRINRDLITREPSGPPPILE